VRKRYLLVAGAGVLALVFAAVALGSPTLKQTAKVNYTKNKAKKSTGLFANFGADDPGATPPGNFPGADKVVIKFKGAKVDTNAAPQCKLSQLPACPSKTKIGSGTATANIVGTNPTTGQTTVTPYPGTLHITAFNAKGRLFLVIKETGTVLKPKFSKKGTLVADVKGDVPPLPGGNKVILKTFKVKTKPKSRKIKGKKHILFRTPKCPKSKKWKVSVKFTYADGDTRSFNLKQKCTR
jgi:hypothetical protein